MTEDPPDLFSYPGLARNSDPATSHEAAASVDATKMEEIVYAAIKSFGSAGCISDDVLQALSGYAYGTITPRYRPLISKNLVEITGERRKGNSGRSQRVMVAL